MAREWLSQSDVDEVSRLASLPLHVGGDNQRSDPQAVLCMRRLDGLQLKWNARGVPSAMLDRENYARVFVKLIRHRQQCCGKQRVSSNQCHTSVDSSRAAVAAVSIRTLIHPDDSNDMFQPYFSRRGRAKGLDWHCERNNWNTAAIRAEMMPRGCAVVIDLPSMKHSRWAWAGAVGSQARFWYEKRIAKFSESGLHVRPPPTEISTLV